MGSTCVIGSITAVALRLRARNRAHALAERRPRAACFSELFLRSSL